MVRPYQVILIGQRGARLNMDITDKVVSVDKWVDAGSGEVASCSIMFDILDGTLRVGTPRIDQYDELLVRMGYSDETRQERVFFVNRLQPQRTHQGALMQVECFGREEYLRRYFVAGHYRFTPYSDIIADLCNGFLNPGQRQPLIVCDLDAVPEYAVGSMDFGDGATSAYDAIMQVLGRLNQGTSAGGVGDILSLTFHDRPIREGLPDSSDPDYDTLELTVRSQGSHNAGDTTPTDTRPTVSAAADDFISCSQVIDPEDANHVIVRGQQDFGSLPVEYAEWRSALETMANYPEWATGIAYREGFRVRYKGSVYERLSGLGGSTSVSPTNTTAWSRYRLHQLLGDTSSSEFNYSPWTKGRAQAWQNMASNPGNNRAQGIDSPAYPDVNTHIRDDDNERTEVMFGPINSLGDIPTQYRGTSSRTTAGVTSINDGDRILCGPTFSLPGTPRVTADPYGNAYANSVAARVGSRLIVVRSTATTPLPGFEAISVERGEQVIVLRTARIYEWQRSFTSGSYRDARDRSTSGSLAWRDVTLTRLGGDCFHRPTHIENVEGLLGRDQHRLNGNAYSANSAIRIAYQATFNTGMVSFFESVNGGALGNFLTLISGLSGAAETAARSVELGAQGWWATLFEAPWPTTNQGSETRRSIFANDVFDSNNLNRSAAGHSGLYSSTADWLGETSGIAWLFWFAMHRGQLGDPLLAFQGDFPFWATVFDRFNTIWVAPQNVRIQGETQQMRTFWSDYRVFRPRAPWGTTNQLLNLTVPERLEFEQLDPRNIKRIGFQFQRPYDEFGRYTPWTQWADYFQTVLTPTSNVITFEGIIDGVHFMKQPRAHSADTSALRTVAGPVLDYPEVSNIQQLKNIAAVERDVAQARDAAFAIKTTGRTDIALDDTIFYHDELTVPESDNGANTRKLVVTKLRHSATATAGWVTDVDAIDRVGD